MRLNKVIQNDLIYKYSSLGIVLIDKNKRIIQANPAFCRLLHYKEKELIGQPITIILPPDDSDIEQLKDLMAGKIKHYRRSRTYVSKTGHRIPAQVIVSKMGEYVLGIVEDLTLLTIKEQEIELAYGQAQVYARDLLAEIERRKEVEKQLQGLVTELEKFVYVVSHDLQEPLRTIHTYAELMEQDPKETEEAIRVILSNSEWMQKLITSLLRYARIGTLESERVDIDMVLTQVLDNLATSIEETQGKIIIHCAGIVVKAGEVHVYRVFQNLIHNALKYSKNNPVIEIRCQKVDGHVEFAISDNGIGIERRYFEHIFIIFKRLEPGGLGVGLSECKKIIENYGGKIWVESEVGKGSTFYFTLPAF